jgi:hypothetical protein
VTPPLTVVVPVYNEGANLPEWWRAAAPYVPAGTVVRLIYDFEEDDTLPVARALAAAGAPIEWVRNRGKGVLGALLTGLSSVEAGPVLVSMADLCDDLSAVPAMLEAYAGGASVVVASRFMTGGRQLGGPLLKRWLARCGSAVLHLAGFPVRDASNSFRLYDSGLVKRISIESTGGFEIGFEITLKAWQAGARIVEVPTTWRERVRGESRFRTWRWLPRYARLWARAFAHGLHASRRNNPRSSPITPG